MLSKNSRSTKRIVVIIAVEIKVEVELTRDDIELLTLAMSKVLGETELQERL